MNKENPIGIIGLGAVGSALKHTCEYFHKDVRGYDIKESYDWVPILDCTVVFVCVPTPGGSDGRLDCSAINHVLARLARDDFKGIVTIKSTVRAGFMLSARLDYPGLRLVYCPEFIRERSGLQWMICPDRVVLAGEPNDVRTVLDVLNWVEDAKVILTDYRSAEVGKLAHNAYVATKVSFTNEMESICMDLGANPDDVMEIITADRRVICKEHLRPHLGPYGGKCVPKDTRELMNASKSSHLLKAVESVNLKASEQKGDNMTVEHEGVKKDAWAAVRQ